MRSGDATDHWNRLRKNLQLAASVGLNSYRFSIEWSRLEPEEGLWNTVALNRYGEILLEGEWLGPCRIMLAGEGGDKDSTRARTATNLSRKRTRSSTTPDPAVLLTRMRQVPALHVMRLTFPLWS